MSTPNPSLKESLRQKSQVLTVVGEQVSLKPTGLAGADNIIVGFDEKYKPPGLNEDQLDLLKRTFQRLFSGSGVFFGNPQPNPPCNKTEKELILKSLKHRFVKLRSVVQSERERDSVRFRQSLKHLFDLKGYIDWFEKAPCSEGADEPFKGALGALSDDDIKKLLKQFIFLILQGQNPLENYTSVDPNPAAFVGRLEQGAVPDFNAFLEEYRAKNYPIPERITKVLEVAELDINAIRAAIDAALVERMKEIMDHMKDLIPNPADLNCEGIDFNVYTPAMIIKLFECLHGKMNGWNDEKVALTEELNVTKQALAACNDKVKAKDDEIAIIQGRIAMFESQATDLKGQIAQREGNEKELQILLDAANKKVVELEGVIRTLQAEKTQLEEVNRGLLTRLDEQTAEIKRLREVIEGLQGKVVELQKLKESEEAIQQRLANASQIKLQLEDALDRIKELEAARDALVGTHQKELADLQANLEALQKEKNSLDSTQKEVIEALDKEIADLEAKIAAFPQEKQVLQDQLQSEIDVLKDQLKAAQNSGTAGKEERNVTIGDLKKQLQAKEAELEALRASSGEEASALKKQLEELSAAIATEKANAERLQAEQANEINRLKKELVSSNLSLKQMLSETEQDHALAMDTLQKEWEGKMENQLRALQEVQDQLLKMGQERDAYLNQMNALSAKVNDLTASGEGKQNELTELRADLAKLQSEKDTLEAQMNAEVKRLTDLLAAEGEKLTALQTNYDSMVAQGKTKEQELQAALEALRDEGVVKDQDLEERKREIEKLAVDLKACQEARAALESRATTAEASAAKLAELQQSLAGVQTALETSQAENQALRKEKEDLTAAHENALKLLREEHDKELAQKEKEHQAQIDSLGGKISETSQEHKTALEQAQVAHQAALDKLNEEHSARIAELKAAQEAQAAELQARIEKANTDCEERLNQAKAAADQQIADLQAKLNEANADQRAKQEAIDTLQREKTALEAEKAEKDAQITELQRTSGEGAAAKDQQITALQAEKAGLEEQLAAKDAQITELQRTSGDTTAKNAQIAKLEEEKAVKEIELGEKDAALAKLKQEQTVELQKRDRRLDMMIKKIEEIAQWVQEGADKKALPTKLPEVDEPLKRHTKLQEIIDNVAKLPLGTGERKELTPDEQRIETENEMNRCYLIFFAAYLMGRHFPKSKEDATSEQGKQQFIFKITSCLEGTTFRDGTTITGLYTYLMEKASIDRENAIMMTLNTLTKVLDQMEEIHDSGNKQEAYSFKYELLNADEIDLLKYMAKNLISLIHRESPTLSVVQSINGFQENLQRYLNIRGGPVDKDLSDIFLGFTKAENVPIVIYARDEKKVVTRTYPSEKDFQARLAKNKKEIDPSRFKTLDPKEAKGLIDNDVLNFPLLFYVYLFVFKDYLNVIDTPDSCPLPKILRNK